MELVDGQAALDIARNGKLDDGPGTQTVFWHADRQRETYGSGWFVRVRGNSVVAWVPMAIAVEAGLVSPAEAAKQEALIDPLAEIQQLANLESVTDKAFWQDQWYHFSGGAADTLGAIADAPALVYNKIGDALKYTVNVVGPNVGKWLIYILIFAALIAAIVLFK